MNFRVLIGLNLNREKEREKNPSRKALDDALLVGTQTPRPIYFFPRTYTSTEFGVKLPFLVRKLWYFLTPIYGESSLKSTLWGWNDVDVDLMKEEENMIRVFARDKYTETYEQRINRFGAEE